MIEKSGESTNLNHTSFAHSLFDNQIEDLAHRYTSGAIRTIDVRRVDDIFTFFVYDKHDFLAKLPAFNFESLIYLLLRPKIKT